MELKSENKDEQTIQSKPYQGISNRAFLPSEPLSEMDAIKALPSEIPVDMVSNDVSTSTNSNTMKGNFIFFNIVSILSGQNYNY